MTHKGLKEPHVFLASSNPQKLIKNLQGILTDTELQKISDAVNINVKQLFLLGESHFQFAQGIHKVEWRQRISRLYYAAYNVNRSITLMSNGEFSTDSTDHQKVGTLPKTFNNQSLYQTKLKNLRDDRNLADYSHLANEADLLIPTIEAEKLVQDFIVDARSFLTGNGLIL